MRAAFPSTSSIRLLGATLVSVVAIAAPSAAHAHVGASGTLSGSDLHAAEIDLLGAEHAAEHSEMRSEQRRLQARWKAMSPAQRRDRRQAEQLKTKRIVAATADLPKRKFGEWAQAPFPIPNYAIHSALLPTGKVLFWGYPPMGTNGKRVNRGVATLWDPAVGTGPEAFEDAAPPAGDPDGDGEQATGALPIYCSGQTPLANGSLLVTGGSLVFPSNSNTDAYTNWAGLNTALTFDPWTEEWVRQPDMDVGRWYPTQTLLADGSTMIIGGYGADAPGGTLTERAELFDPPSDPSGIGSFRDLPDYDSNPLGGTLYPHAFLLPNGNVNVNGPYPEDSATLDLSRGTGDARWRDTQNLQEKRQGGTAVLLPSGIGGSWRMLEMGGYGYSSRNEDGTPTGRAVATKTTERFDARKPGLGWRYDSNLKVARSYANTVQLPDSSMVTIGGGSGLSPERGNYETDAEGARRQVELYDPKTKKWALGPAQQEDRTYHSTALLLPDGRVWSAGDDFRPYDADGSPADTDTGEIYSPPYLFRGERPRIKFASTKPIEPGGRLSVQTTPDAERAVLVAPGATTHSVDMHQRVIKLGTEKRTRRGLRLKAPVSNAVAPPGYYMLFVLNDRGVPSLAKWVQIAGSKPGLPG